MEFNEEKAKELIDKYSLSPTTLKVWETRNRIPDKYADESYENPIFITEKADYIIWNRVLSVLQMKEINTDTFIHLVKADRARFYATIKGKSRVTVNEFTGFIKEIKRLKIDILKWTEKYTEKGFMNLISDERLKHFVIANNDYIGKRLQHGREGRLILCENDFIEVRDNYIKVAIQLNVN